MSVHADLARLIPLLSGGLPLYFVQVSQRFLGVCKDMSALLDILRGTIALRKEEGPMSGGPATEWGTVHLGTYQVIMHANPPLRAKHV